MKRLSRRKTTKICFQAITPFGTFTRCSERLYVACVARADGWHQFCMSQDAAEKEFRYQLRRGRDVVRVLTSQLSE